MNVLGLPTPMLLVFVATILAGSLAAIHYLIWHVLLGRPFGDEDRPAEIREPGERTAEAGPDEPRGSDSGTSPPDTASRDGDDHPPPGELHR